MANTLGQLMENSIKLMFDNASKDIRINSADSLSIYMRDSNYSRRLANILPAINSGLEQCRKANALPRKSANLPLSVLHDPEISATKGRFTRVDLRLAMKDFAKIESLAIAAGDQYTVTTCPLMEGDNILLIRDCRASVCDYTVIYIPKVYQVSSETPVTEIMDIPNEIFVSLPYWIKGSLYEIDEPEMAERAKKTFYEMLTPIKPLSEIGAKIKQVYCED